MTQTMLAGRLDVATKEFQVKEIPVPTPGPSEVRIKVKAAGVCLSDVHLISGQVSPPRITDGEITLGHEVAGTVEKLGADVEGWQVGDRVTVQALIEKADGVHTLGVDYDGGWAEYMVTTSHSTRHRSFPMRFPHRGPQSTRQHAYAPVKPSVCGGWVASAPTPFSYYAWWCRADHCD